MYSNEYLQRVKKFRDAARFQKTDGVPILNSTTSWMIYDAGLMPQDVFYDYALTEKVLREHLDRYDFDGYTAAFATYAFPVLDALGGGIYQLDSETGAMSVIDHDFITPEDYPYLAEHPEQLFRYGFAKKFPNATTDQFRAAIGQFMRFGQWAGKATPIYTQEYGKPIVAGGPRSVFAPIEMLNVGLRGLKSLGIDMRRHKSALKAFCDNYWEKVEYPSAQYCVSLPESDDYIFDGRVSMLAHAFMSPKQFEEFYWPYLKKFVDMAAEKNKLVYIFCEASMMRFMEFFQEFPKGTVVLHLEEDDLIEVRKQLPNVALAGGLPVEYLGFATPEKCVDTAKHMIDSLGEGYIMSQNKVMAYRTDCKRENLEAVIDFVHNYKP